MGFLVTRTSSGSCCRSQTTWVGSAQLPAAPTLIASTACPTTDGEGFTTSSLTALSLPMCGPGWLTCGPASQADTSPSQLHTASLASPIALVYLVRSWTPQYGEPSTPLPYTIFGMPGRTGPMTPWPPLGPRPSALTSSPLLSLASLSCTGRPQDPLPRASHDALGRSRPSLTSGPREGACARTALMAG